VRLSHDFRDRFSTEVLDAMSRDRSVIIGVDADVRIGLLNDAWYQRARAYDAESSLASYDLGSGFLGAMTEEVRVEHVRFLDRVRQSGQPGQLDYDCNDEQHLRRFHLVAYPLSGGGLLMVHSTVFECGVDADPEEDFERRFENEHGLVLRCAYCGRYRSNVDVDLWERAGDPRRDQVGRVSHGMCYPCAAFLLGM
jgi:hypothetical protein